LQISWMLRVLCTRWGLTLVELCFIRYDTYEI
jgi:hypothetical protein